jgi:alanyl-tRNA synthetase
VKSEEIRSRFLKFFEARGHKIIPSASLVPAEELSVTNKTLFTTAGMQPLIPNLLGAPHPSGKRLVDVQKCVRTGDIDEVGDNAHLTFFEMLGNWSLGDYFKEDAIKWSYELLTSKKEGFGLDPKRLYITVFEGDGNAPRDDESARLWEAAGVPKNRIYFMPADKNWWEAGPDGPCGPDTEMYYDLTEEGLGDLAREQFIEADSKQQAVEIWNDVFMEYEKKGGKVVGKLPQKNVDTGAGLERLAAVLQKKKSVFETDLLAPIMGKIDEYSPNGDARAKRIVADHIRAAVFMIADGVTPSNTDRGYVLRRILRRAVLYGGKLGLRGNDYSDIANAVVHTFRDIYSDVLENIRTVKTEIGGEVERFGKTLGRGMRELEKICKISLNGDSANRLPAQFVFELVTTLGFPFELIKEIARERGLEVDEATFLRDMREHRELSRAGAEQKFKGGLADHSDKVIQYHTATHLLHQALRDVLGAHVGQKGSNITAERLRFDFTHPQKMTPEEIKKTEEIVNTKIAAGLPVNRAVLPLAEAEKTGALRFFGEKYGDEVSIYYVGDNIETAYSKEFCGGPHVANTGELRGRFIISKEEAVSAGIRRIKAVLQ